MHNKNILRQRRSVCEVSWKVLTAHFPKSQTVPAIVLDHSQFRQFDGHAKQYTIFLLVFLVSGNVLDSDVY